jgi:hypothetical protein
MAIPKGVQTHATAMKKVMSSHEGLTTQDL